MNTRDLNAKPTSHDVISALTASWKANILKYQVRKMLVVWRLVMATFFVLYKPLAKIMGAPNVLTCSK